MYKYMYMGIYTYIYIYIYIYICIYIYIDTQLNTLTHIPTYPHTKNTNKDLVNRSDRSGDP